ncbi:MAG: hypothetical protein ACYC9J_14395 [Sulfuricaulis sp.]
MGALTLLRRFIENSRVGYGVHRFLVFGLLGLSFGGCAVYTATSGQVVLMDDSTVVNVRFSDNDRMLVRGYYNKSVSRQNLSSRVNLAVGRALPPGTRGESLPRELEQKLSPLPSAYVRLRVGWDIVLIEKQTRMVQDILRIAGS